jgi:hypothetical protein
LRIIKHGKEEAESVKDLGIAGLGSWLNVSELSLTQTDREAWKHVVGDLASYLLIQ